MPLQPVRSAYSTENARRPLEGAWAYIVNGAELTAVTLFIQARTKEDNLSDKTVLSPSIAATIRAALCLDADFINAPAWLSDTAYQRICGLGLHKKTDLKFMTQAEFIADRERFVRELLESFHRWPTEALNESQQKGLGQLTLASSLSRRREWLVGLAPQKQRRLNLFAQLASDVGRTDGIHGLWLLVPANNQSPLPTLNHKPIPITNAAQPARITEAWLSNRHRAVETFK
ncbi:MAG TPA: hypothetical protein VF492_12255 [Verrucomicrobiae bacterium]